MADRRVGNQSMGRKGRPKMDHGTCNVCSAPCSSCMHRNTGFSGSKSDESFDENSHGVVASQCSFDVAIEVNNKVNSNQDTSSEIRSGSRKDQDYMKVDSCNVLQKEVKPQSSLSDHQARNIPGQGKVDEKSGAENSKDKKNILTETSTHSDQSGRVGNSGENILLSEPEESNTSAMSESESADSDLEVDVKICDICGDAGREDLLAICSRCSDGAEHTYCMRVMLIKVPESGWLCEECKFAEQAEKKKLETKGKRETEVKLNTESSSKRHIDKFEAAPDAKRQAVEASTGSPKRSVLPKLSALSRETSFKGLEKTTRKLAHHSSFKSHSDDDAESTRATDSQHQSSKGSLSKSNSLNYNSSRSKVIPVDDVMIPRQKTAKEHASLNAKEGFSRNVGKSSSTRCIDVGNSSCNDSKVKGLKQLKDQSTEANPSVSTVDLKLISRGNLSISDANGARDSKGLQSDGRQGGLTKQTRYNRNRLEDIVASVGDASTNEKFNSSEQISNAKRKDELANVDFREVGEKIKDTATPRNIREDINKGNRLRAAVDAALRKKPSFGRNRGLEQSDLPAVSNVDSSCDKAFQNLTSKVPVVRDWPVGLQGGHPNLRTDKQTTALNGKQFPVAGADAISEPRPVEPEIHFPYVKPVTRDFPVLAPTILSTTSAIPEHEYIWQGDLEVQKSRNVSAMHSGMQAYISTLASPKVVQVVSQFPVKVTLNEVPRLSTWPAQFQDTGAKEDHVALFFFAKDTESYEKIYKPLVDNMIQKDLALKGSLEGVELLVFTSNQLPQNCQRWNNFYFLWGVFRGKKQNSANPLKNTPLPLAASCVLSNEGKPFSAREGFSHENSRNRESLTDRSSGRMQSCIEVENAKEDVVCGAIDKEKAFSGDSGAVEETEEGEIGEIPHLKDEKTSGSGTVNEMNQKVDLNDPDEERLREGPVNKKLKTGTRGEPFGNESVSIKYGARLCEVEKMIQKKSNATERIVFPLDLNDVKQDDDEMVDNNPRQLGNDEDDNNKRKSLGMVPNLELALGEEKTTPTMTTSRVVLPFRTGTTSIEEHRSSCSKKPEEDNAASSLSLSLSFSSLEKEQEQNQRWEDKKKKNVNSSLFLFRDLHDKSS